MIIFKGQCPVDHRTHQPIKLLHGGASVVLAETLGSFATHMAGEPGCKCVGLEVNANHIRTVSEGALLHEQQSQYILEVLPRSGVLQFVMKKIELFVFQDLLWLF